MTASTGEPPLVGPVCQMGGLEGGTGLLQIHLAATRIRNYFELLRSEGISGASSAAVSPVTSALKASPGSPVIRSHLHEIFDQSPAMLG